MELQRTLRADNSTIKWVLDTLDADRNCASPPDSDREQRYPYRIPALQVEVQLHNGGVERLAVPARNIGVDGVSFLVGTLMYPDTRCRIDLITTHNHWQSIQGKVVGCRYVPGTGSVYEANVRFQQPIDLALFIAQAMRVRVLLVDDSVTSRALLSKLLRDLNADVVACDGGQQAIDLASMQHFDLLLMDMEMPGVDGFQATRTLRARGYAQPIVAVTGLTGAGDRERCLQAGCDDYLPKPTSPEALGELIDRLRPEPLVTSLCADHPQLAKLVDEFVSDLRLRAAYIQKTLESADLMALEREARMLRGEAPSFGFEPIGAVAGELEHALRQGLPAPDIHVIVGKLVRLCCAARPASARHAS